MSYSFLLVSGSTNTPTIPVGAVYNGQTATLRRKTATIDSNNVIANGKATFTIPANRINEFAGNYQITVNSTVVQSGDIDIIGTPGGSSDGGGGNVDLTNYPTKSEVNGLVSAKADKAYVDTQLSSKASVAELASKVNASEIKSVALSGVYTDLTGRPNLADYATTTALSNGLANKADASTVVDKATISYVDTELAKKATVTALTAKADKTYVDTNLTAKANAADVYPRAEVDNKISAIETNVTAPANAMVVVAHGTNSSFARPNGANAVYWLGSAEPVNMTSYDLWNDGVTNPPAALTLNGDGGNATASFTVNGGDNATAFALYQGSTATGTPVATSFPATVTGLTNGTAYSFVATATNSMGSVTSNVVSVTPQAVATTVYNRNFTSDAQTTGGGSAPSIIDVNSALYIGYFSNDEALSLWQPALNTTTSTTNFGFAPTPAPGTSKMSTTIVMRSRSTNTTAIYPRVVTAATNTTASPDYYGASFYPTAAGATTGTWQIFRFVGGTSTVVATSAATANISFPKEVELRFTPSTGLVELCLDGSATPTLTYTDPAPLSGRYGGVGFRTLASDTNASALQAITRLTVKTL